MTAAHRWRRNELIDFASAEGSQGFTASALLSAGGVSVSRGRLAANDGVEIGSAELVVAVIESDAFEIEWRAADKTPRRRLLLPNSAQIALAGMPRHARWAARPTILVVSFDRELVDKLRKETGVREGDEGCAHLGVRDPVIDAAMSKMRLELQFGGWSGPCYLESLGVVLAVHLLRNYLNARALRVARGGLGTRRLRLVIDFIEARLGEEITQEDLARIAELSPHHFASAFRTSAGVAPHRYLTERRIARGCELLAKSEANVTTIAHALGFASHAHFSDSFRRFVGVTPSQYMAQSRERLK